MLNRFRRIKIEFGTSVFVRLIVLSAGLVGMIFPDVFYLSGFLAPIIVVTGLLLGFLLKNQIPKGLEYYPKIISAGLFVYGIILFLGDRPGIGNHLKLAIITATTVVIFNLQFWSLSDPSAAGK